MNIYLIGMCVAMLLYVLIGAVISRRIKDANDFYVAGRRAPLILISGSVIASYVSTGLFIGDAGEAYSGIYAMIVMTTTMQVAGYLLGSVFFGRYLRRSKALTIPEFFGIRFCSKKLQVLASVCGILMMTVYLLSVVQGIGTLMTTVTGVDYNLCITIAMISLTILTVMSGSSGVLITDTIMASVFTVALVVAVVVISGQTGGWFTAVKAIAADPGTRDLFSWHGRSSYLYPSGIENIIWALNTGFVWMGVCMVGPWQSSRYLMAKNEHTVVRSALVSAAGVFALEFFTLTTSVFIHLLNPELEQPTQAMLWAALNILPLALGVVVLTGVLSAGISSATTFLSLIGASFANDILSSKKEHSVRTGRVVMVIVSVVVLALAITNPPSIYWIMLLGGAVVTSTYLPVAVASTFSKRVTKAGAFWGMLTGLLVCFGMKLYSAIFTVTMPAYLDPSVVGMLGNILVMVIVSAFTQVSDEEAAVRKALLVAPAEEKNPVQVKRTLTWAKCICVFGVLVTVVLLALWVIPYHQGLPA